MLTFLQSLKSRLLFLLFIVTVPGLIAIFYQATDQRDRAIEFAKHRAVAVAEYSAAEQLEIIKETESFLQRLSASPLLLTPEAPECSLFLANLLYLTDSYVNLGVPRADGELLCNASPLTQRVNVADRAYIQEAIQERDFAIGKFQFDRAAQVTSINFAYPVINPENNRLISLAVAVVSLEWWSKRLDHSNLPENSVAYLTDAENKIIAVYPENRSQLGLLIGNVQGLQALNSDKQTEISEDDRGRLRIFVKRELMKIKDNGSVNIFVGIPFDSELMVINSRLRLTIIWFMIFMCLLAIFSVWAIGKSVLKPIQALGKSSRGEQVDDLLIETTELIGLHTNFTAMAKNKRDAELQLKSSQDNLSRHLQNNPLGAISWDGNYIISEWNSIAELIFGYTAEEAIGCNISELVVAPELRAEFIRSYDLLLEHQGAEHCKSVHITKAREVITCNWYNTLIINDEGIVSGVDALVQDISADKRNQDALDNFFELPDNLHAMLAFDGTALRVNTGWQNILGYSSSALLGNNILRLVHPDDLDATNLEIAKLEKGKSTLNFENRLQSKGGESRLIAWSASASLEEQIIYAVGRDITESRIAEDKLKLAAGVFTHAKEAIFITDPEANIIDVNDTFIQLSGYTREETIGQNPSLFKSDRQSEHFYQTMWEAINKQGHWSGEIWNKRKNGEVYPQLTTISSICDSAGKVLHYIALFIDISRIKEHQKQLEHITHFDLLTNLPNRTLLADRLLQAMPHCKRHRRSLAVAFLDLDGFKAVNDAHGHRVGDQLLVKLSQRLQRVLREGDTLSRFGGDEFVAVLVDLENLHQCEVILERLLEVVSMPVVINDLTINLSASIGVTIYPHDGVDAEQLLRHADQAMYSAKQEGKNRYHLFDMAEDVAMKQQHNSLIRIREALQNNELVLYYQPKVNMKSGDLVGVEALIRWQHPEHGLLAPSEFLPVIEQDKLIIEVGEWVIDSALHQISAWQKLGLQINISVNIDALQLQQGGFVKRLTALLAAHPDVSAKCLGLEVLETSKLADIAEVSEVMHACIKLGVSFALDDFGTGYCSLTYLKQLPVSLVKIDQSFIRDMLDDPDDLAIVKGVMGLSRAFQRDVIAEGVETLAHGTALLNLGCYLAQGYGIAKPMPAAALPGWIDSWRPDEAWAQVKTPS